MAHDCHLDDVNHLIIVCKDRVADSSDPWEYCTSGKFCKLESTAKTVSDTYSQKGHVTVMLADQQQTRLVRRHIS